MYAFLWGAGVTVSLERKLERYDLSDRLQRFPVPGEIKGRADLFLKEN